MHPRTWPLAAALLGCLCVAAASPQLVLVDSHDAAYLRTGEAVTVNKATLSSLLSALSGLVPAAHIDGSTSDAIANVLKPSPVRKPRAVVVVNVAGISPEDTRSGVFSSDRGQRQVTLDAAADNHASAVVDVIAAMAAANPDVQLVLLDQAGLQNCDAACLQMNLATAAEVFGATFAEGDASSGSTMTFASGAALQLSSPEAKLFSVELASLVAGVKGVAQQAAQAKELGQLEADVALYEVSLVSLAALAEQLGSSAPEVSESAKDAVITLLKWATQQLDAAYGGDVAYQVMHLDDSVRGATTRSLLSWKDHSRVLLTTQYPPEDEDAAARMFSVKAAGYGAFILLLYFSLAGIWCMCCMPMVKDTLLFGSRKAE